MHYLNFVSSFNVNGGHVVRRLGCQMVVDSFHGQVRSKTKETYMCCFPAGLTTFKR